MNPERYKRVDQVFQQALSQPPESVESFLREACAGDEDLRREIESLIEHERQAGSVSWPDSPESGAGLGRVRPQFSEQSDLELPGRSLLHYHIVEKIGQVAWSRLSGGRQHLAPGRDQGAASRENADPGRRRFIHEARRPPQSPEHHYDRRHHSATASTSLASTWQVPLADLIDGNTSGNARYVIQMDARSAPSASSTGTRSRQTSIPRTAVPGSATGLAKLTHAEQRRLGSRS
jgi:hypothetical protein